VRPTRRQIISLALLSFAATCTGARKMGKTPELSDDDFAKVRYPTYEDGPCSPDPSLDFRGLMIRLPRKVVVPVNGPLALKPDTPLLPVCGLIRLSKAEFDALNVNAIKGVVLVFVDQETGTPTSFNLRPDKPEIVPDEQGSVDDGTPELRPEDQKAKNVSFSDYFNVDAFMFCPDFPRRSARYRVHALLGKHRSNSVEVEVEAK
jgi:hypothetical protein